MDDSALKEALQRLLSHGDAMKDRGLMKMAADKKKPPMAAEVCPKCGAPMDEGDGSMPDKCAKCGYEKADAEDDGGDMASLLEQGSQE